VEYGGAETDLLARDLDLSDLGAFRWAPSQALPAPLRPCALTPLAPPKALWAFDLMAPPEGGAVKEVDFEFDREGAVNAVAVWARVRLIGDVILTTGGSPGGGGAWTGVQRQIFSVCGRRLGWAQQQKRGRSFG
jgi:hypothetical protein